MDSDRQKQIEELHRAALEREPDARAAFLDVTCPDKDLRREVESLLTQSVDKTLSEVAGLDELATREMDSRQLQWPAGPHLNNYHILSKLQGGNMGVVYVARDPKLARKIAIKMLPPEHTQDATRLRRFEREARAASDINHPNVITVYEVGECNGTHFIATEFIEGHTLRRIIATQKLELCEMLKIGEQIAAALDATHRAGVVHRDIKPENTMIRPDGLVKVLDFGLARLTGDRATSGDRQANSGAATSGVWVGTPRYMSPEQVKGLELDARTDIFSLGVVLYEMITGQPPFPAEKADELFDEICYKDPPPVSRLNASVPAELDKTVRKALAKDPNRRFQKAGELQNRLQSLRQKLEREKEEERSFWRKHRTRIRVATALGASVLLALFLWWWWHLPPRPPDTKVNRLATIIGSDLSASFSPDGRKIAYSPDKEGQHVILIRGVESEGVTAITDGTAKDRQPIWSPDGERLAFVSDRANSFGIWSVSTLGGDGGAPQRLAEIQTQTINLTRWSRKRDGIYFEVPPNLYFLDLKTHTQTPLTDFEPLHTARGFSVSPDESRIAYSAKTGQSYRIFVKPLPAGQERQITEGGGDKDLSPQWLPDNETIVYCSRLDDIYQVFRVNLNNRKPVQITVGVSSNLSIAVSPTGNRILTLSPQGPTSIYYWDLSKGLEVEQAPEYEIELLPEVSPDGSRMVLHASNAMLSDASIVVREVGDRRRSSRKIEGREAKWGADNDLFAFLGGPADPPHLWTFRISDGRTRQLTEEGIPITGWTNIPRNRLSPSYNWSPDGTKMAYSTRSGNMRKLRVVSISDSQGQTLATTLDPAMKISSPFWSPDGSRLAYVVEPITYSSSSMRSINVIDNGVPRSVFERNVPLRLLGWSGPGLKSALYVAVGELKLPTPEQEVSLFEVTLDGGKALSFPKLRSVYLYSVKLARSGEHIAFVSRESGRDNLYLVNTITTVLKKVTSNTDATVYYSGLTWSPDNRRLFYSKETKSWVATRIENFE